MSNLLQRSLASFQGMTEAQEGLQVGECVWSELCFLSLSASPLWSINYVEASLTGTLII